MSEKKKYAWTLYPMIFMFITTVAALILTSYNLFKAVFTGAAKGAAYIGNSLMGLVAIFLVIAALILAVEGIKAFGRYRAVKAEAAPAKA
jgi:carbon starvation protein CstA